MASVLCSLPHHKRKPYQHRRSGAAALVTLALCVLRADGLLKPRAEYTAAFDEHVKAYGLSFSSGREFEDQLSAFAANDDTITAHNADTDATFTLGHNAFSHLTWAEFAARFHLDTNYGEEAASAWAGAARVHTAATDSEHSQEAESVDWVARGAVTSVKDQGPHGYCGTFGRVASAEGQYGARSGFGARNLSVEQLIDCVGWDLDQTAGAFLSTGLMAEEDYPYNLTAYPDADPPVPGNPCRFDAGRVVPGSVFSNHTAVPVRYGEDAFAAGVYAWGPLQVGVNADVFGERDDDGFVTAAGCAKHDGEDIDHSVTLVGYGTDDTKGDFWIIKNSWGTAFADGGYVYMARGVNCANILEADAGLYTFGPPELYYPWA